jgi:hypothetical protein
LTAGETLFEDVLSQVFETRAAQALSGVSVVSGDLSARKGRFAGQFGDTE